MDFEARFRGRAKRAGMADGSRLALRFFKNLRVKSVPMSNFTSVSAVTAVVKPYEDADLARRNSSKKKSRRSTSSSSDASSSSSSDSDVSMSGKKSSTKRFKQLQVTIPNAVTEDLADLRRMIVEVQADRRPPGPPVDRPVCQVCGGVGHATAQCWYRSPGMTQRGRGGRGRGGNFRGRGRAGGRGRGAAQCYSCGDYGHMSWDCHARAPAPNVQCYRCQGRGHYARDCSFRPVGSAPPNPNLHPVGVPYGPPVNFSAGSAAGRPPVQPGN